MPKSILSHLIEDLTEGLGLDIEIEDSPSYTIALADRELQIEMDDKSEFVIVSTILGKIPAGMYREKILEQALKSNGYPPPLFGFFSYNEQADILVLHRRFPISKITKKTLMDALPGFVSLAKSWDQALSSASIPIASKPDPSQVPNMLEILGIKSE